MLEDYVEERRKCYEAQIKNLKDAVMSSFEDELDRILSDKDNISEFIDLDFNICVEYDMRNSRQSHKKITLRNFNQYNEGLTKETEEK